MQDKCQCVVLQKSIFRKRKYMTDIKVFAVGMPVARHPPHRSQRAGLPHWAPALGHDAEALLRVRMRDANCWYPPAHVTLHALPGDGSLLAPSREASLPTPRDLLLKPLQRFDIERHAIIAIMAQQHRAQPSALHGDGLVPSPSQLDFDLGHFDTKPLRHGPPLHPELASS